MRLINDSCIDNKLENSSFEQKASILPEGNSFFRVESPFAIEIVLQHHGIIYCLSQKVR